MTPNRLPLAGAEPLQPLAVRLERAAKTYPFLSALLLEAARQVRTESGAKVETAADRARRRHGEA